MRLCWGNKFISRSQLHNVKLFNCSCSYYMPGVTGHGLCFSHLLKDPDGWRPHGDNVRGIESWWVIQRLWNTAVWKCHPSLSSERTGENQSNYEDTAKHIDVSGCSVNLKGLCATCCNQATKSWKRATLSYLALYFLHSACLRVGLSISLLMKLLVKSCLFSFTKSFQRMHIR